MFSRAGSPMAASTTTITAAARTNCAAGLAAVLYGAAGGSPIASSSPPCPPAFASGRSGPRLAKRVGIDVRGLGEDVGRAISMVL
jgi:hypothetical protein